MRTTTYSTTNTLYNNAVDALEGIIKKLMSTRNLEIVNDKIIPIVRVLCVITGIAGFVMVLGGVGTWDYYGELGTIPPVEEEHAAIVSCVLGIVVFALSAGTGFLSEVILRNNEDLLRERFIRREKAKARRQENIKWNIGSYLYEHNILVDRDSDMWDYTYGEPAIARRARNARKEVK